MRLIFKILLAVLCLINISSCRTYLDIERNSIASDYMTFRYNKDYNELDYFNKVNGVADKEVFYTTHFTIRLPKNIVYWKQLGNKFYFEYASKQIIYIYTSYKNEGKESDNWEVRDLEEGKDFSYLDEYWTNERGYNEDDLYKRNKERITKFYTNGKYAILLYNIKEKNYPPFLESIKTFRVK
ncbi:hypothetical protein A8C56_02875 [Niabella ginsenosidivorans]|uniref:Uncharacterized protein n=1 Tax=Niabella ginsenosidivorans TaxID=1176587 RepID=A0A1A9HXF3_9BACT|nr:hypothetical protein [Niabella ginsenosidivorans]ANH80066.1 hypothetical protein A8C56_02875 [Niabella ginsenosidivorans]